MHFRGSNFKHKTKRLQILQKLIYEKFYVQKKILRTQIAAAILSKIYSLKNAKKHVNQKTAI